MGVVYRAADARLGRAGALKLLPAHSTGDADRLRRFEAEARRASALNHPNILTVHDVGVEGELHFIATELIEGETLRSRLARSTPPLHEALGIALQVAEALDAAHEAGIMHRDVKPENVMIRRRDGYVKVLDFGLAKLTQERPAAEVGSRDATLALTRAGFVVGTPAYMSPEQARGQKTDARTDIWSLGVMLYEMLAGRRPFGGETCEDVRASVLRDEPPPLPAHVPPALCAVVGRALTKNPEGRYPSISLMVSELRGLKAAGLAAVPSRTGGEAATPSTPHAPRRFFAAPGRRRAAAAAALALLLGAAAVGVIYFRGGGGAVDSLAVLPFQNVGGDPDTEYFSDGVTESLINSLSQLPGLKVMSRSSVFRFKGQEADVREVAGRLGVRAVLTGRVRQRGDTLSVSVELVDARDNSNIWGETYNRRLADILAVQGEIAREISEKLRPKLTGAEREKVARNYTENVEAYRLYLQGEYFRNKWTDEGTAKAIEFYQRAVAQDPAYAPAYRGMALTYGIRAINGMSDPREDFPKAKAAATRALEIDESFAEAHHTLGHIALFHDRDWPTAGREFERAIELKPNDSGLYGLYAIYLSLMGRTSEAVAAGRRGVELDPLLMIAYWDLLAVYYYTGQFDQAIEVGRKAREIDPDFPLTRVGLGIAYRQKGMYEEAVAELRHPSLRGRADALAYLAHTLAASGKRAEASKVLEDLRRQSEQKYVPPVWLALAHAGLGEKDEAFAQLEKGYRERASKMFYVQADPAFAPLHSDPRYAGLLERLGLAPRDASPP
jgi:TolB-like protein/Flp pilus assembly protein TadD